MKLLNFPDGSELKTEIKGKSNMKIHDIKEIKPQDQVLKNSSSKKFYPLSLADKVVDDLIHAKL